MFIILCFLLSTAGCGKTIKFDEGKNMKLCRIVGEGVAGGVCSGFAYYSNTPVWIWRAGFVGLFLIYGVGIISYCILWTFMPKYDKTPIDYDIRT